MQTADLAYVSPTGQETPLTDEQLVEAAANTPPVGASRSETAAQSADNAAANRAPAQEGTDGAHAAAEDEHPDGRNRPVGHAFASRRRVVALPGVDWN